MADIRCRMTKPHTSDCIFAEDDLSVMVHIPGYTWPDPDHFYGDKLGRKNGSSTHWQIWICNDPGCSARAIVATGDIGRVVNTALVGVDTWPTQ